MTHSITELIYVRPDNPPQFPLGRHLHHDPRNLLPQYLAVSSPPPKAKVPYKVWNTLTVYDQLDTPSCTAQAATGLLRTTPYAATQTQREYNLFDTHDERQAAYLRWQQYDPWYPEPHDGSSTDAPFKGLRAEGLITAWNWLRGEQQLRDWLTWYGPAVVGTVWYTDMFWPSPLPSLTNPKPDELYITPTGEVAGGHAYRIVQYSKTRDAYRVVNSWSRDWGDNGRVWIRSQDLAFLLQQDGEAVTIKL